MNATDFSSQHGGHRSRSGRGADPWLHVDIPVVDPAGWFLGEIEAGIKQVERLRRDADAAMSMLVAAMPQNRDTTAAVARATGGSNQASRAKVNVAKMVAKVPGALDALKAGKVSAEHLAALAPVADTPGVASLLAEVGTKSPETLAREALQMKLSMECGSDVVKRQYQQRFVRFFDGPDGMIGISGLFPPLEGADLKTKLAAVVDARYRAAHPERAKTLGGHNEDTREQRTADALLEMCGVRSRWKPPTPNWGIQATTQQPPTMMPRSMSLRAILQRIDQLQNEPQHLVARPAQSCTCRHRDQLHHPPHRRHSPTTTPQRMTPTRTHQAPHQPQTSPDPHARANATNTAGPLRR